MVDIDTAGDDGGRMVGCGTADASSGAITNGRPFIVTFDPILIVHLPFAVGGNVAVVVIDGAVSLGRG